MRIQLAFQLGEETLPLQYRRSFMSFIKNSIASYQPDKFDAYFDKNQCLSKSFSFAVTFPKGTTFSRKGITLPQKRCFLTFSTADFADIALFYNAFLGQKGKPFPLGKGNQLSLYRISYVQQKPIFAAETVVRMMSPLVLRLHCREDNGKDRYVSYGDPDFNEVAQEVIRKQLAKAGYVGETVLITPKRAKRTIVSEFDTTFAVTIGVLQLSGRPECLSYLLESGMGNRRNAGFGLFCEVN